MQEYQTADPERRSHPLVRLFDAGDLQLVQRINDSMQMLFGQMQILGRGLQIFIA
jgi:hypothetical protein